MSDRTWSAAATARRIALWALLLAVVLSGRAVPRHAHPARAASQATDPPLPPYEIAGQFGGHSLAVAVSGGHAYVGVGLRLVKVDFRVPSALVTLAESRPLAAEPTAVVVRDGLAHVSLKDFGLTILDADTLEPVGGVSASGSASDVDVGAGYAYLASGDSGLHVIDVRQPSGPRIAALADAVPVNCVRVVDGLAYLAGSDGTIGGTHFSIFDVADPEHPRQVSRLAILDAPHAVHVAGPRAYVGTRTGFEIVNVTDPAKPLVTDRYESGNRVGIVHLCPSGGLLYGAAGDVGLQVFDVSSPSGVSEIGLYRTTGPALAVSVSGDTAFVAASDAGLIAIDVADPTSPSEIAVVRTGATAEAVRMQGGLAYVAGGRDGLRIVDISDPERSRTVGTWQPASGSVVGLDVTGTLAIVVGPDLGLAAVSVAEPDRPLALGRLATDGGPLDVRVRGTLAYIARGHEGLLIADISVPDAPGEMGACDTPGVASDVDVQGSYAYVADGPGGVRIIDVADRAAPRDVASLALEGSASGVDVVGDLAYVAEETGIRGRLRVFDVSDPASPRMLSTVDLAGPARSVRAVGDIVYVTVLDDGLRIFDLSFPSAPRESTAAFQEGLRNAADIDVAGEQACVAALEQGLRIVDLSDSRGPHQIGRAPSYGAAWYVDVSGDRAYVSAPGHGLHIVDVAMSERPRHRGTLDVDVLALDAQITGALAYVADYDGALIVADVSDPERPREIGRQREPSTHRMGLEVKGSIAYAVGTNLDIIDVSRPSAPRLLGHMELREAAWDVAVGDGVAFVAGGGAGLLSVPLEDLARLSVADAYPVDLAAMGVTLGGDRAFVAAKSEGLLVIDVSDPRHLTRIGSLATEDARAVHVVGSTAYVADASSGLYVIDVSDPRRPRVIGRQAMPYGAMDVFAGSRFAAVAGSDLGLLDLLPAAPRAYLPLVATGREVPTG